MTDRKPIDNSARKETIRRLRAKYVLSPRDEKLDAALAELVERMEDKTIEARCLVLFGQSGAGKSKSLRRAFKKAFPTWHEETPAADCPLISVKVEGSCTMKTLGRLTLTELGYPLSSEKTQHRIWEMVRQHVALRDVGYIHYDEIQNIMETANETEATNLRNTLKSFINDPKRRACLILSGLPKIVNFLRRDPQVGRRCDFLELPPIDPSEAHKIHNRLKEYANDAHLSVEAQETNALASRLLHAVDYQFGSVFEFAVDAIEIALRKGDSSLTCLHFAERYAKKTGCSAPENPFVADNWIEIDCSGIDESDEDDS